MKTIKQIADKIGVSKQRIYRYIKRECISEAHQNNGVMYYDEAAEALIIQGFSDNTASDKPHHEVHYNTVNDAVIDMLKNELEIKNKQIAEQSKTIENLSAALAAAQALHAGTIQQQLHAGTVDSPDPEPAPQRKSFWNRIFVKK